MRVAERKKSRQKALLMYKTVGHVRLWCVIMNVTCRSTLKGRQSSWADRRRGTFNSVFSAGGRKSVAVDADVVGRCPSWLVDLLHVHHGVSIVLGFRELVVRSTVSRRRLTNTITTKRHPERIYHIVRCNAVQIVMCFDIGLLTVYTLLMCSVFLTFIYVIIVLISYFFLEPALMGLRPSGFQPNKYCCVVNDLYTGPSSKLPIGCPSVLYNCNLFS